MSSFFVPNSRQIRPVPQEIIYHIARGEMANWFNGDDGDVGWMKPGHRGIQRLDKVVIPRKQRKGIEDPSFEIRYNAAFDKVIDHCADLRREGKTWITPELKAGLITLNQMGFCYSCETWQHGQLVGAVFGMHIGSFVSADSMFHTVDNASKAAYVRNFLHLRQRGFEFVDCNYASETVLRYGGEWVAEWQFEQMVRPLLRQPRSLVDGGPTPVLPAGLAARLRLEHLLGKFVRKLRSFRKPATPESQPPVDASTPAPAPESSDDSNNPSAHAA